MLTFHLESGTATSFPNPLHLLSGDAIPISQPILIGATHGRVDAQSVLVDRAGRTWLIGFRHAEPGPLLRDFVYLEDALKTHFAQGMDLPAFHALEQRLLDVSDLFSPIPTDDLSPHQKKLVESVMHIRHLTAERVGSKSVPYFAGLLACTLAHVAAFDATLKNYSNRELMPYVRSLLQAAMLSAKLTAPLPASTELPAQAYNSLWLDNENKVVWVEGKEIELTPQDYELLLYFYERTGELCTRKEVLRDGLKDPSELIHATRKLNSAVSRVRLKIEPDPEKPKYLKTMRGQGYKLVL